MPTLRGCIPARMIVRCSILVPTAGEKKTIRYFLGIVPGALADYDKAVKMVKDKLTMLRKPGMAQAQFEKLKQ